MVRNIKVGIPIIGGRGWLGGVSYTEVLVKAVSALPVEERPQMILIVQDGNLGDIELYLPFLSHFDGAIYFGNSPEALAGIIPSIQACVQTWDELYEQVDLLFPMLSSVQVGYSAISWIPDFQHVYLPQFFSQDEIRQRDRSFTQVARDAQFVVLSSQDALNDFQGLFPDSQAMVRVLNFHHLPQPNWYLQDPVEVQQKYGLPDVFLISCNQFWAHKNHRALFEAIARLEEMGIHMPLVCTGATEDYRNRDYFAELRAYAAELGIDDRLHILGSIPREDQIQLIRRATALVQPSLFEGWSTVIEDGRALGKKMFLSDLDVHKEQAPEGACYFERSNAQDLAACIAEAYDSLSPGPDLAREAEAQARAQEMVTSYALTFCTIIQEAWSRFQELSMLRTTASLAQLPDRRAFNILLAEEDLKTFKSSFRAYVDAFSPTDDLALHVLAGERLDEVHSLILDVLRELNLDPEAIPDVSVLDIAATPAHLSAYLPSVNLAIGSAPLLELARHMSIPAHSHPTTAGLQEAFEQYFKVQRVDDAALPFISVITPSFNQAEFIEQTIESVLAQGYSNFEHIVMDGGSTDGTIEILKRYSHLNWVSEKDRGQSHALNKGLRRAKGEIIAWINSDDWYEPGAFELVANFFLQNPDANVVMGDCNLTDKAGRVFDVVVNHPRSFEDMLQYRVGRSIPTQPAIFFRRSLLDRCGYVDESLHFTMDYDLWLRFSIDNHFFHIEKTLVNYRFHEDAKIGDQDWSKIYPECEAVASRYRHLSRKPPKVSVVIPCYNYAHFLSEAVESVVAQTCQDFEIIIVNDGSTDNSAEVAQNLIAAYPRHRITLIDQQNSGHPAISRNRGIEQAAGKYILCLDADDTIAPTMLEECVRVLDSNPAVSIAYTDQLHVSHDGRRLVETQDYDFQSLLKANYIGTCSLFRRHAWEGVGGYKAIGYEDWEFWIGCGEQGYFGKRIPKPLFHYRVGHAGVYSQDLKRDRQHRAQIILNHASVYGPDDQVWAQGVLNPTSATPNLVGRIVALVAAYNEGDVIAHVVGDLIANGLEVYLIDNNSTDDTVEQASKWLGKGLIHVERFPQDAGYPERSAREYVWRDLLRRKEELAAQLGADWYIHSDADEFRESPWPGMTLAEAIRRVDSLGYNAINFELLNFRPVNNDFVPGSDVREHLTYYEPCEWYDALQIKAWKNTGKPVRIAASGGHNIDFSGRRVSPVPFILRHYPIRSEDHGRRKVFAERLPRFAQEERAGGWHVQYDELAKGNSEFLHDPANLTRYDANELRARLFGAVATNLMLLNTLQGCDSAHAPLDQAALHDWLERTLKRAVSSEEVEHCLKLLSHLASTGAPLSDVLPLVDEVQIPLFELMAGVQLTLANVRGDGLSAKRWSEIKQEVASLAPAAATTRLPDARGYNIVVEGGDLAAVKRYLRVYLEAFSPSDDVALHLIAKEDVARLHEVVLSELERLGRNPEDIPDVSIVDGDIVGVAGADLVLGDARAVAKARESGCPAFIDVTPEALRTAFETFRGEKRVAPSLAPSIAVPGDSPFVSIVIPLFNKVEYTERCLEALIQNTPSERFEVILVDNASTDGTGELLACLEGDVRIIQNPLNLGFAKACNQGAALARGKHLIFLNNDTLPQAGWLEALIEEVESSDDIGIVGCKLLYPESGKIQHAGIGWINGFPDHPYRHADPEAPEVNHPRDLDMVTGACMLIRRDLFESVGGFDEGYLNGVEDIDLCLQVRRAGYRVRYTPESVLYHFEGTSEGRFDHVAPNLQRFFRRWQGCFDVEGNFIPPASPIPVRWEGSQFVYHSLAHVNRELCRSLIAARSLDLEVIPYEASQFDADVIPALRPIAQRVGRKLTEATRVHVRHQWPPRFDPPPEGAWVMVQPWEFGGIPQDWVAPMQEQVDEIWVPSSWVREGYIRSGIPAEKVVVVPNGVDTDLYHPEGERFPLATRKAFKFLFVGGTIGRKGIDILLETYREVFSRQDDVCLVIKTNGGNAHYLGMSLDEEIKRMALDPSCPEIEVIEADLSDAEVAALYRACDALVHPYRGEGFGMPIAEAMASALPVIVTGYGACLDFCDPETAYLIPAREVALDVHALQPPSVGYWYGEPDRAALKHLMRELPSNPGLAKAKGIRARERMIARYQWPHVAEVALARIEELATRLPVRFAQGDPFRVGGNPLQIEGRRKVVFFHHPDWSAASWQEVVLSYAQAFDKDADVSLALWLDPSQGVGEEEAGLRVLEMLAQSGIDSEQAPDILLVPDRLDLTGLARLYAATDCVVPAGDDLQASRAARLGLSLLEDLAPHAWQDRFSQHEAKEIASGLNSVEGLPK